MTKDMPERAYGQIILDTVSAYQGDESAPQMDLAVQGILECGAVSIAQSDDGAIDVNLSKAIGATILLVESLVTMVREQSGEERDVVIAVARERFDRAVDAQGQGG